MSLEGPATAERIWVKLAPKNANLGEAGLSFPSRRETVSTEATADVKESLRKGRLQFIGKDKRRHEVAA